ncbi:MAG TPA: hypothetical protein VH540_21755 [Ktedonobacterales bacterium]|jgi:hypothetical protein
MYQERRTRLIDRWPLPPVRTISAYLLRVWIVALVLTPIVGLIGGLLGLPAMFVSLLSSALEITFLQLLGFAWLFNRIAQTAIARVLSDGRTIYWTYSEQEWPQFTTQSWRRENWNILMGLGILIGLALVADLTLASAHRNPGAYIVWEAAFVAAYGLLLLLKAVFTLLSRRRTLAREVYINPEGIIMSGWYTSLRSLRSISLEAGDPATLRFLIRAGRNRSRTIEVPVPRGREAEAEYLAQHFQKE